MKSARSDWKPCRALAQLARANAVWPNAAGEALLFALRGGYEPEVGDECEAETATIPAGPDQDGDKPASVIAAENEDGKSAFPTSTLGAILNDAPEAREVVGLPGDGVELTPMDMERLALARRIKGKKRVPLAPKVVLHEDIRCFAARVLGDIYHADVTDELAASLENGESDLCLAAADSLARIGMQISPLPEAVTQILMERMATAGRDTKLLLIRALAASDSQEVQELLLEQLRHEDSFVRSETVQALARMGYAGPEIEALLDDSDSAVRLSAAQAVAGADDDGAVKLLVDFALSFEGYHRRQTASLLRKLDAAQASALFIDVLQDPDRKRVWSVAIEALGELNCSQPVLTLEV